MSQPQVPLLEKVDNPPSSNNKSYRFWNGVVVPQKVAAQNEYEGENMISVANTFEVYMIYTIGYY